MKNNAIKYHTVIHKGKNKYSLSIHNFFLGSIHKIVKKTVRINILAASCQPTFKHRHTRIYT